MKRFAVTVFVDAEDALHAVLAAGDLLLDEDADQLAAHSDALIQVREVPA
jgi:hypothetical protein